MEAGSPQARAVVLLSGGLDSAVCLAIAQEGGFACTCLTCDYGQRHGVEVGRAKAIAARAGCEHRVVSINLRAVGGSALTGDLGVPKGRDHPEQAAGIPATYVPARNMVFLSIAAGLAEVVGARDIFIGVNAIDYSGYPDCRAEFIAAFERAANLGTAAGAAGGRLRVRSPLVAMTKAQVIREGLGLGVEFAGTSSCYDPWDDGRPCGACDACVLRARGFAEAGVADPLLAAVPREPGRSNGPGGS